MKIRHIFFDLDNTLWDHRKNAVLCIQELFNNQKVNEKYAINFDDFHNKYYEINEKLWEDFRDEKINKENLRSRRFPDSFAHFGVFDDKLVNYFEENFLDNVIKYNELLPNSLEILEYLKCKSYKLHILSNGFQDVTINKIKLSGLLTYFTTITSADEINKRKPHPDIFDYALKKANADKNECIFVGDDWIADVLGAHDFGIKPIYYNILNEKSHQTNFTEILDLIELKNIL